MCCKIRCDKKSEKFYKISQKLNKVSEHAYLALKIPATTLRWLARPSGTQKTRVQAFGVSCRSILVNGGCHELQGAVAAPDCRRSSSSIYTYRGLYCSWIQYCWQPTGVHCSLGPLLLNITGMYCLLDPYYSA